VFVEHTGIITTARALTEANADRKPAAFKRPNLGAFSVAIEAEMKTLWAIL
jgi:hypothetical protein